MPTKAQSANKARLKRMHSNAKAYMRKHPSAKYSTALKEAGKKERGKKVSGVKKKKPAKKKAAKRKSNHLYSSSLTIGKVKKSPRKRKAVGMIGSMTDAQTITTVRKIKEERLAWALFNQRNAKTAKARKKFAVDVQRLTKQVKALS